MKGDSDDMNSFWKTILWSQFGAAMDMLANAVRACPDELWTDRSQHLQFWYVVYHTLFFLDLYLSGTLEGFRPPAPFTLDELDPSGRKPERPYTKNESLAYLEHCRAKCRTTIETLTDANVRQRCPFPWWQGGEMSFGELLLYTMRHVQEHTAQLSLMLGQTHNLPPDWDDWIGRTS